MGATDMQIGAAEVMAEAQRLDFSLGLEQAELLARYLGLLLKWNRAMNLVGRARWPEVFRDLAADSLFLAQFLAAELPLEAPVTLDLGAGAGLPGIPLRVLWQAGEYVMVELREKRSVFLRTAVAALTLPRTRVEHGRAEDAPAALSRLGLAARADLVVSRAFLPWPKLLPLAKELLQPNGLLVILANERAPEGFFTQPEGFALVAERAYPSGGKTRYFWGLTPASA